MADVAAFRVYVTKHQDGRLTGILMRWREKWLEGPAPSGYGRDEKEVLEELEARVLELRAAGDDIERYLWKESFHTRRVALRVHPRTMVGTLPVVGHHTTPLRLSFAWSQVKSGAYRVMLPRWGWWSLFENLDDVPPVLESLVGGALHGQDPRWLYDFREQGEERVLEWPAGRLGDKAPQRETEDLSAFPVTSQVGDEWVSRARRRKLALVVGEDEHSESVARLIAKGPQPLLLVGGPGVGKTATMRKVALHLSRIKGAPRLWSTSAERLVAGMVYLGMWQERCLAIIGELAQDGDFLFAGRLTTLCRPLGGGGSLAEALTQAAVGREIGLVAECSDAELVHCRRTHPSLINACRVVHIRETPPDRMLELMQSYQLRRRTSAVIDPPGLGRLARYLDRYVPGTLFPGKAIVFLDWLQRETSLDRTTTLDPDDVTNAFARYTGLPVELVSDSHSATGTQIAEHLGAQVVGQDDACQVAGRVLARFKAGMADPERPLGALLFVGPTGVGKTELAKQLARYMFGDEKRIIRLDMAEYGHRGSGRRLLDVGEGVVSLATQLAAAPLSLVLLDELEKAHSEVHDLLLAVLGEGRITDADGRLVDARMALFVMTSNLGADAPPPVGFGDGPSEQSTKAVRDHFRPEFFGRIDHVVPFRHLSPEDVGQIVDLELAKVQRRPGFRRRFITLRVHEAARTWLAHRGYHREWGARPLRRLIEEAVVSPIAVQLAADPGLTHAEILVEVVGDVLVTRRG